MSNLGLDIAASGLDAQQALLDTAAQNLANVTTAGYAQETVNLSPEPTQSGTGVGQGVLITSVTGASSTLYEALATAAGGQLGAANETASVQSAAQAAFPEPGSNGLSASLDQLFSDLSALASQPSSAAAAATVVQDARNVAGTFNSMYSQLGAASAQLATSLQGAGGNGGLLGQANELINQIAQLNGAIVAGVGSGQNPNELIDARRAAISQLSTIAGVSTSAQADGSTTVSVNGIELVSGTTATDLQVSGSATAGTLAVSTVDNVTVPAGGQIGAILTGVDTTIAGYQSQLSAVADSLATSLNALQSGGVSANGTPGPTSVAAAGWTGPLLPGTVFVDGGSPTSYTAGPASAATIAVNPALVATPSLIATAAGSSTAGVATIDPTTAQQMAAVGQSASGPLPLYQTLVGRVGSQTQQATNVQQGAQALADTASSNLAGIEGVNSNQQTVDVLAAQRAFQATASVINSMNTAFQSLLQAV